MMPKGMIGMSQGGFPPGMIGMGMPNGMQGGMMVTP